MPTVDKIWCWTADSEGLADAGLDGAVAFSWEPNDGTTGGGLCASANGCAKFVCTTTSHTGLEYGLRSAPGETWQTWGVPAGNIVTAIQIREVYTRKFSIGTNDVGNLKIDVVDAGGMVVHSGGVLANVDFIAPPPGGWTAQGLQLSRPVDSAYQASTTDVRLRLSGSVTTGFFLANLDFRVDPLQLRMTYESAPAGMDRRRGFTTYFFQGGLWRPKREIWKPGMA